MDQTSDHPASPDHGQFLRLLMEHQHRLFGYLFALVGNRQDAEDLAQECSVVMWEKFDTFGPGSNFAAWMFRIALNMARNHHRKAARGGVTFSDAMIDAVADRLAAQREHENERAAALRGCLGKLSDRDRTLVMTRYEPDGGVAVAAAATDRTLTAAYKALARVRRALLECVQRRLAAQET